MGQFSSATGTLLTTTRIDPGDINPGWVIFLRRHWVISTPPLTVFAGATGERVERVVILGGIVAPNMTVTNH